ncbi:hypothetical protein HAX54_043451 [Datura stramonium]|uniref:Uncharacterized protein n=1 Tax=Datura stramonium TaxID=4076 RepID=A0ABS8RNZ6_DATST|nr:hypothetical protein [Datura stramonium]
MSRGFLSPVHTHGLLIDPHVPKDGSNSPDPVIDNPLSKTLYSMWGRFFRNAELEKMVDQDLSRLYPEHSVFPDSWMPSHVEENSATLVPSTSRVWLQTRNA